VGNPLDVRPLPNLDRNIRVGDSLAADAALDGTADLTHGSRLRRLRERYARASGRGKASLARQLDREERRVALSKIEHDLVAVSTMRRDLLGAMRGRDLFGDRGTPAADASAHAAMLRRRAASLRCERRRLLAGGALPFSFAVH